MFWKDAAHGQFTIVLESKLGHTNKRFRVVAGCENSDSFEVASVNSGENAERIRGSLARVGDPRVRLAAADSDDL